MQDVRTFRPGDEVGIRTVMEASLAVDGIPGFLPSDIDRAIDRIPPDPEGTVVAIEDGLVVGYCTPRHDDLTVLPSHRRRGHGRRLAEAATEIARERGHEHLTLYVPAHLPASQAFAEGLGFRYHSSLWQFELPPGHDVPGPAFPDDVIARPLAPDEDLGRFVRLMNLSFTGHPTPMSWTEALVRHVHDLPDFDADGVLILASASDPEELIGFSRVEVDENAAAGGDGRLGMVSLIGVVPTWRRRGLGRQLLRWGVAHLRSRGHGTIDLSVEAANDRATRLYRDHGFHPTIEWPHWVLATGATGATEASAAVPELEASAR
jgi:mycothiol synthase